MTWLGIWANLGLFALKALAGVLGRSAAMIADAGHTLSDLVSDMGALLVGCDMCTCGFLVSEDGGYFPDRADALCASTHLSLQ